MMIDQESKLFHPETAILWEIERYFHKLLVYLSGPAHMGQNNASGEDWVTTCQIARDYLIILHIIVKHCKTI